VVEYHQVRQTQKYRKETEDDYGIEDIDSFPVHFISPCP
jgi:hypothetical protein